MPAKAVDALEALQPEQSLSRPWAAPTEKRGAFQRQVAHQPGDIQGAPPLLVRHAAKPPRAARPERRPLAAPTEKRGALQQRVLPVEGPTAPVGAGHARESDRCQETPRPEPALSRAWPAPTKALPVPTAGGASTGGYTRAPPLLVRHAAKPPRAARPERRPWAAPTRIRGTFQRRVGCGPCPLASATPPRTRIADCSAAHPRRGTCASGA